MENGALVPVVREHGKLRPEKVLINGKVKESKDGTFYIEWREGGKRIQRPCGSTSREALDAWRTRQAELNGTGVSLDDAAIVTAEQGIIPAHGLISAAIKTFLAEARATKGPAPWMRTDQILSGSDGT